MDVYKHKNEERKHLCMFIPRHSQYVHIMKRENFEMSLTHRNEN